MTSECVRFRNHSQETWLETVTEKKKR